MRLGLALGTLALALFAAVPESSGAARPPAAPVEADRKASVEKLETLMVAVVNYTSTYDDDLPNDVYSKDGKPLLSWRVLMLPYLNEEELFRAFRRDEPWDSEHNKKVAERMPDVFTPVRVKAKDGETFYEGFSGVGAVFGPDKVGDGKTVKYDRIPDGPANVGLIFEAASPVFWTKPGGLPFDWKKPLPKLGGMFDGEFHVAFADGEVRRFRKNPDEAELKKVIGYDDGARFDLKKLLAE